MRRINTMLLVVIIGAFMTSPALAITEVQKDVKEDHSESTEIVADESTSTIDKDIASKIIEKLSRKQNIPKERLEVLKSGKIKFEISNNELTEAKVLDKESGEVYGITIDTKGNEVDKNKVEQKEEAAYRQQYGKKTKGLYEELNKKRDTDRINVGIWLFRGETEIKENSNFIESIDAEAPVIAEIKKRGKIRYASEYAPLIYAELSKKDIKELEKREDVEIVDKEGIAKRELNSAVPTIRANLVWPYVTGSGVKVAVVEDDGIAFANPYIRDGIYYKPSTPNIDFHATLVAGIIASTHSTYKGVAPGVSLLSANSVDPYESSLIAASDWALRNGASILSLSWGIESDGYLHVTDRYYDYVAARSPYPTVVKSAGNTAGRTTSPGNGWNVIAVGAVDDLNTASWFSPSADMIAEYSAYIDPISPHSDREKPEVAAVGSRIISTDTGPWISAEEWQGTSFAGPAVAGVAALLMSKNTTLKRQPETIRAIIFASAVHNIPPGGSRLSEKDGTGAVVANEAYNVVARKQFKHAIIYSTSTYPIRYRLYATAGKKVRVVISWDSKSTGPYGTDSLKVDLDLLVKNPTGSSVGYSSSWDNNYEIVEFKAPVSGYYTVEVTKRRWDSGHPSERLGYAYSIT